MTRSEPNAEAAHVVKLLEAAISVPGDPDTGLALMLADLDAVMSRGEPVDLTGALSQLLADAQLMADADHG